MVTCRLHESREKREPHSRRRCAALSLAIAGIALLSSCAQEKVIGINERIHHDDFEYRVTQFKVTDSIGSGENRKQASGHFYVVTFEVENRAMRVGHDWDNSIAYVVDDQGRRYENLSEMQSLLNTVVPFNYLSRHHTPAGATERTQFVFDLPGEVAHPCLMVRGFPMMGDMFDGEAFTKTKVKLF
jgi:hypothetical protein